MRIISVIVFAIMALLVGLACVWVGIGMASLAAQFGSWQVARGIAVPFFILFCAAALTK